MPALVDFHKPPEAVPTYMISGFDSTTSIEVILPLIPPGPMFLGAASFSHVVENCCAPNCMVQIKKSIENKCLIIIVLIKM